MFNYFDYFNKGFIFGATTDKYNPYINYSWSQTLTVGGNQQIKDSGTVVFNFHSLILIIASITIYACVFLR